MILGSIVTGVVGAVCIVLGILIWKKEKITLLHDYHYDKVNEAHKKVFCTLTGIGIIALGIGIFIAGVLLGLTGSLWSFLPFGVGLIISLSLLIYAGKKYNHA